MLNSDLCSRSLRWSPVAFAAPLLLLACNADPKQDSTDGNSAPGDTSKIEPYNAITVQDVVHFTGTEPFWGGQVRGGALTYTTLDNAEGDTIAVRLFAGRGGVSWSGQWRGEGFRLAVTEGTCSDGMSERTYPFLATVLAGGEQRSGCAWTARRPFSEGKVQEAPEQLSSIASRDLIVSEWRKAENHAECAPIGFAIPVEGDPRRANFSGGWAVAWDRPGLRSAFGVAGTGNLPGDADSVQQQRARLAAQWPLLRELSALPQPSFAGYGIEGAGAYPSDNPQGKGLNSLAYVRVAGQSCDYNVWSRLGRGHLERLLDSLRLIPQR